VAPGNREQQRIVEQLLQQNAFGRVDGDTDDGEVHATGGGACVREGLLTEVIEYCDTALVERVLELPTNATA
jgi:hypothetical protein